MSLVHWIADAPVDVRLLGGKAASVARLARMGLPTPTGFVVAAGSYQAYLDSSGAALDARRLVAELPDPEAEVRLDRLAHEYPLPAPLAADLADAVERLTGEGNPLRLAVRSSAQHEDSLESSFAGQHETILGVEPSAVETAVRRCWASLWSARSVAYRRSQGLPVATADEMAVLVQPLVDAVASAVVFTVNPVTGEHEEVLVEAARGLGEQIVSGAVTVDALVLDRVTLRPQRIGGEGAELLDTTNGDAALAVSFDDAASLAELCLRAERGFRSPLDLEAAHDGKRWWLLQARPITTVAAPARMPAHADANTRSNEPADALVGYAPSGANGGGR